MHRFRVPAVLVACLALAGCANVMQTLQNAPKPTARVSDVRLGGLDFRTATLVFDVEIDNPLSVGVPLLDLDLALASAGSPFASADVPVSGMVPAGGSRTVECPVTIDLVETVRTLSGVRPGALVDYRAELGVGVELPVVGRQRLPMAKEGQLPIPAPPRVSVDAFRMDDVGLTGVTGTTVVRVGNPNRFAVALNALDVGLRLAGRDVGDLSARAPLALDAEGEGTVELPLRLSTLDLGTALLDVFRGESAAYGLAGVAELSTPFGTLSAPVDVGGDAPIQR